MVFLDCMKSSVRNSFIPLLVLVGTLGLTGCNQEEFYEKEYLEPLGKSAQDFEDSDYTEEDKAVLANAESGSGSSDSLGNSLGNSLGSSLANSDSNSDESGPDSSGDQGDQIGSDPSGSGSSESGSGIACTPSATVDHYTQNAEQVGKVDILWVVDNSGSMGNEQDALARNFDAFINGFLTKGIDFRMAITTTDASRAARDGRLVGRILTSADALADEAAFKNDFKTFIKVGTGGSGIEQGLHSSLTFLAINGNTFLRSDANLVIVYISDEEDQSPESINALLAGIKGFKGTVAGVRAYSIVTTELIGNQWETIGNRYMDISNQTAGIVSSIHEDFFQILTNMGDSILDLLENFATSKNPISGSLNVSVNGSVQNQGWSFDSTARLVKFESDYVPAPGAQIEINYQVCQ
ncbi:MAG: VWA domain-containing protein [Bdellovibrio sp.]|nr:VWA domain-containing protein [Bdellovibrio sp.]